MIVSIQNSSSTLLYYILVFCRAEIFRRNCGTIDVLTRENLKIVADLLHVAKDEFDALNESATEAPSFDKEPTELVRGAYKEGKCSAERNNVFLTRSTVASTLSVRKQVQLSAEEEFVSTIFLGFKLFPGKPDFFG